MKGKEGCKHEGRRENKRKKGEAEKMGKRGRVIKG